MHLGIITHDSWTAPQHKEWTQGYSSTDFTPAVVLQSQPSTHLKSKGQRNQQMHTDLNDFSAMTAYSYPFLTLLCLSAQPVIWHARPPLPMTVPEGGQEQIQSLNHITKKKKKRETHCRYTLEKLAPWIIWVQVDHNCRVARCTTIVFVRWFGPLYGVQPIISSFQWPITQATDAVTGSYITGHVTYLSIKAHFEGIARFRSLCSSTAVRRPAILTTCVNNRSLTWRGRIPHYWYFGSDRCKVILSLWYNNPTCQLGTSYPPGNSHIGVLEVHPSTPVCLSENQLDCKIKSVMLWQEADMNRIQVSGSKPKSGRQTIGANSKSTDYTQKMKHVCGQRGISSTHFLCEQPVNHAVS